MEAPTDPLEASLQTLSAYRAVLATNPLETSNLSSLPKEVRQKDKGGSGPNTLLVLYGDSSGVTAQICKTDCDPNVRITVYGGMEAIEITTSSRGLGVAVQPTFRSSKLVFSTYHTILAVLNELTGYHKLPLEWAAWWILANRSKLTTIDCYTSFIDKKFPSRFLDVNAVMVALEGHHVGVYVPGSTPTILDTTGRIVEGTSSEAAGKPCKDAVPIPIIFIRRSGSLNEQGHPVYYVSSGEVACSTAIKTCHFRIKSTEAVLMEAKPTILDAYNTLRLVQRLLDTNFLVPIPYLNIQEAKRVADLFTEAEFAAKEPKLGH